MKFGSINIFLWSLIKIIFVLLLLLLLISTIYLKDKLGVNLYRYSYYLIDQEYLATEDYFTMGHLIIFNPGIKEAKLKVTIFFEDKDSEIFYLMLRLRERQKRIIKNGLLSQTVILP